MAIRSREKSKDADHLRNGNYCSDFGGHPRDFTSRTDRAADGRHGRPQQSDTGVVGSPVLARPLGPPALPTGLVVIRLLSRHDTFFCQAAPMAGGHAFGCSISMRPTSASAGWLTATCRQARVLPKFARYANRARRIAAMVMTTTPAIQAPTTPVPMGRSDVASSACATIARRRTVLHGLIRRGATMLFLVLFARHTSMCRVDVLVDAHQMHIDQPIDLVV